MVGRMAVSRKPGHCEANLPKPLQSYVISSSWVSVGVRNAIMAGRSILIYALSNKSLIKRRHPRWFPSMLSVWTVDYHMAWLIHKSPVFGCDAVVISCATLV